MTTKIGVIGAGGRMGRMLINAVNEADSATLTAAIEHPDSSLLGADAGEVAGIGKLDVAIVGDLAQVIDDVDVLIDFSLPDSTEANLKLCGSKQVSMVIGTTGFNENQQQLLQDTAANTAMVYAGNYSTGVNVSLKLLETAAKAFGDTVDIEVIEAHHRHKVDAPSGTAFMMAEAAAKPLGRDLKEHAVYAREGHTGARERKSIGMQTIRGGDIVGEHTVMFIGEGERLEIRHIATNRMNFAAGAVRAAQWIVNQPAKLYDMQDVLGLSDS